MASRSASREVERGRAAEAARDEQRLLHLQEEIAALVRSGAVDAEADPDARVEQPAHRRDPRAEPEVRARAVRDAGAGGGETADLGVGEVDAMGAPDVLGQPAELLEVLDGRAAEPLAAELLLLDRLGQVRVQLQAELAGERRRLGHQLARDGERRAGSDRDLDARARPGLVQRGKALRVLEDRVQRLDDRVGRQAAVGLAEIHRAARGDEPDAELLRRLELCLDQPCSPCGKT